MQEACEDRIKDLLKREDEERKEAMDACAKAFVNALAAYGSEHGDLSLSLRIRGRPTSGADRLGQDGPVFSMNEDF